MKYELVIFDLDGTLLNTSPGIFHSVRYAEKEMGLKPIDDAELIKFAGPPPGEMYQKVYGMNEEAAARAVRFHREYGRSRAVYEAEVYPGIVEGLQALRKAGCRLAVATLKPQKIAEYILELYGLAGFFDVIVGMDDSESKTKCQTIREAVVKTGIEEKAVMVGDSVYDLKGAKEAGVDFIGVLYGFGFSAVDACEEERIYAHTIGELMEMLNRDL